MGLLRITEVEREAEMDKIRDAAQVVSSYMNMEGDTDGKSLRATIVASMASGAPIVVRGIFRKKSLEDRNPGLECIEINKLKGYEGPVLWDPDIVRWMADIIGSAEDL